MGDLISFVLYLAGFIVSIIVIVALCQLFAIRRGIEALVKLQSPGGTPAGVTQPAIVPAVVPAQRILKPPASLSPEDRLRVSFVVPVIVVILIVVALVLFAPR